MSTTTLSDPQTLIQDAVKQIKSVATLPEVTTRIIATVEDPNSTAGQLHKIVSHDPALVTRIMKVVNSSFYGLPGQIASVERAIVLLGLNAVKNLATAASLGQLFRSAELCEGFTAKDLWKHCIAVGVAARELARKLKVGLADEAFLAGMIHDIGLLVSLQVFPDQLREVCEAAKDGDRDFCEIERERIGADHQQLGAELTRSWKFPRSCQLVAGYHHRPGALAEDVRLLVTLVYVADTLCCQRNYGFNLTARRQELIPTDVRGIDLDPAMIDQVAAGLDELVAPAWTLLQ